MAKEKITLAPSTWIGLIVLAGSIVTGAGVLMANEAVQDEKIGDLEDAQDQQREKDERLTLLLLEIRDRLVAVETRLTRRKR